MSKLLSYEAIFAALAVVAIESGCAKKEAAQAEPASTMPASPPAPAPSGSAALAPPLKPPAEETKAPGVLVDPAPAPSFAGGKPAVEKGLEAPPKNAPRGAPPAPRSKNAQAACGAGTCSADMKK